MSKNDEPSMVLSQRKKREEVTITEGKVREWISVETQLKRVKKVFRNGVVKSGFIRVERSWEIS